MLHIIGKRYEGIGNKGGRVVVYTLSNGCEYTQHDLMVILGISYSSTLYHRINRFGLESPKVLFSAHGFRPLKKIPPGRGLQIEKNGVASFDRTKTCIKNGLCCTRYGSCQTGRILHPDTWRKPAGDCYEPETLTTGYRSNTGCLTTLHMPG